jgi:hypothetical protein
MLADGTLTVEQASVTASGLEWPPAGLGEGVAVLVWQPRPVVGGPRQRDRSQPDLSRYVREYSVAPFLRRLPQGAQASPGKHEEYQRLLARYGRAGDLPPGYTLVVGHTRHRLAGGGSALSDPRGKLTRQQATDRVRRVGDA